MCRDTTKTTDFESRENEADPMTRLPRRFAATVLCAAMLIGGPAAANPIERACLQSERAAGNQGLCNCIGAAAERTLSRRHMRQGARFFADPQRAQDVRQSDRRAHEELWQAWRQFGETAEAMCG
jgi:hypothetical protein